jgi:hypothetical protein
MNRPLALFSLTHPISIYNHSTISNSIIFINRRNSVVKEGNLHLPLSLQVKCIVIFSTSYSVHHTITCRMYALLTDGFWIGSLNILTSYTQQSELHVITASQLIYILYSSLLQTHYSSQSSLSTSRFLVTDL